MIGIVENYRRGRHTQYKYQVIVKVEGINSKQDACKLIGKRVVWVSPSKLKVFVGKVVRVHGNKGKVRVRFSTGVPGQMIGDIVYIVKSEDLPKIRKILKEMKDIQKVHSQLKKLFNA